MNPPSNRWKSLCYKHFHRFNPKNTIISTYDVITFILGNVQGHTFSGVRAHTMTSSRSSLITFNCSRFSGINDYPWENGCSILSTTTFNMDFYLHGTHNNDNNKLNIEKVLPHCFFTIKSNSIFHLRMNSRYELKLFRFHTLSISSRKFFCIFEF